MADYEESKIVTAADVAWSDGQPFDGSLLLALALPSGYAVAMLEHTRGMRIPLRVIIPIDKGELQESPRLWQTQSIVPPETRWYDFWYDATGKQIATGSLQAINADPYTISVPTLTVPSATGTPPSVTNTSTYAVTSVGSAVLRYEEVTGTKNGTNKTFTFSTAPTEYLGLYRNGILLREDTDYTRSTTTITLDAATPAPESWESLQVGYWV